MSQWETKALGEVCTLVNGGTPKTGVAEYWSGPNLWITPAEMGKRASPYVSDTERKLTDAGLTNCSAEPLPPLSVIMSSRAPIGHLVINTAPMATNQGCKGLIPGRNLDHKFLFYFLGSIVDHLNDLGTGATFKELSGGKLKGVRIPLPPLAEQRRIVAILDEAFARLAMMRANAEANLKNARALFDSHLNAVFSQGGERWEKTTLEKVLELQPQNGWSPPAAHHSEAGTPVLTLSAVTGFVFRPNKIKFTSAVVNPRRSYWVENGDLLITRSNTPELVGHVAIASDITMPTIYPDLIMRMRPKPTYALTTFLYHQLRTDRLRKEITGRAQGANPTMKKISNGAVRSLPIAVPSIEVQRSISSKLEAMEREVSSLELNYRRKLVAIDALKQGILGRAFAGELPGRRVTSPVASSPLTSIDSRAMTAAVMARAFTRHQRHQRDWSFGHVKSQKTLHMVEAVAGFELGRAPRKDAAGPNDMPHMTAAERWAEENRHFKFPKVGDSYRLEPLDAFDALLRRADAIETTQLKAIDRVIDIFIPMDTREAELFATVYAAWNNLIIDRATPTDDAIVREAREDWHREKLKIDRAEFVKALAAVRRSGMIPMGKGKRVGEPPQARFL